MKTITHVKCIEPFTLFGIHHLGECYSCCPVWTKAGSLGRLTEDNTIMDIWNGAKIQWIRQAVLDDNLGGVCDFRCCPLAVKKEYLNLEAMKNDDPRFNHVLDQIMAGQTIMDNPPYTLFLANSEKCNLRCVMCEMSHQYPKQDEIFDEKLFTKVIPEILPGISRVFMAGTGEVLINPYSRKFLQTLDSGRYPSLKINLLTNANLFTPELWKSISHNRYELISISIDAATKETYEKIRVNGNWDILQRNLNLIAGLRRQNNFEQFHITFVVMKSNYKELKEFVDLGLSLGCDRIIFQKIFGEADIRENINLTKNKKVFAEIGQILADPVFQRPEVDAALLEEYRKYTGKRVGLADQIITKAKEWRYYFYKKRYS